jgi:hypothetical protein
MTQAWTDKIVKFALPLLLKWLQKRAASKAAKKGPIQ